MNYPAATNEDQMVMEDDFDLAELENMDPLELQ